MALSKGAITGIVIGVILGIIALGLLIYFVIYPAIVNSINKGKAHSYNGGGSGNTGYIRAWIDSHAIPCKGNSAICPFGDGCVVSAGFA